MNLYKITDINNWEKSRVYVVVSSSKENALKKIKHLLVSTDEPIVVEHDIAAIITIS